MIAVLTRHGIGVATSFLPWRPISRIGLRSPDERPLAIHLREAIEELGTTFIKVGQLLSTRADLLPEEYLAELRRLQDAGPTVPAAPIRDQIESELGRPIDELFAEFEDRPLAAASIGQVHGARLPDGREVVVKVLKPGVVKQVEIDLAVLHDIAATILSRLPDAELYDPRGLVEEFSFALTAELDYVREARNLEAFRRAFAGVPDVRVPEVVWSHSGHGVLTMERLRGIKVDDLVALDAAGIDRHALAVRATGMVFREVFELGEFQADPHPGNLLVLSDGSIGALDFGMVGRLDAFTQECLLASMLGAVEGDVDRVLDELERLGLAVRPVHRPRLRRDVSRLLEAYRGQPLEAFSLASELASIAGLFRRYRLRLPAELLLLLRTLTLAEGVGRHLDPGFVATTVAEPYLRQALLNQALPDRWGPRAARSALNVARLGADLPLRLERILGRLERGEIEIGWRPEGVEPIVRAADAMVNRLSLAVLAAAFVIGASVFLASYRPVGLDLWLVRALLGFGLLTIGALGISLAAQFVGWLRSPRR